jgi:Lipid A core - O-antigen ligase and related enzymes
MGQKDNIQKLTFALVAFMVVIMFLVNLKDQTIREQMLNDSWDRFELWRSGVLANSDLLLGVGTGDYKNVLTEYFKLNHQDAFAKEGLNAHNQFIQIFFSNGLLGLTSIVILLLRPLYLAFKHNDQMGILMIFPFLIYGMTEVFLGRYQGVVFFALLHQIFISFYLFSKKSVHEKVYDF